MTPQIKSRITRLGFLGGFLAAITAKAQSIFQSSPTVITACAPVYGKFPTLCDGQCPVCGLAHGPVTLQDLDRLASLNGIFTMDNGQWAILKACTRCYGVFARPVLNGIRDEWLESR